jgi:S-adenosyl-L-methionine hydrolase (adenosine-forming)
MPIALTTDFGYQDAFVGIMKGVIAAINPTVQVIDVTHGVPARDIMAAALVLRHAIGYFPPGTIHVAVVDPGVGSRRAPLLIESEDQYLIGPDNGIFSLALQDRAPTRIVRLSNPDYHLKPTSRTFHGRDIFAPVAAYLTLGVALAEFGEGTDSYVKLVLPQIARREQAIEAEIIYIDAYGNLFTNLDGRDLTELPAAGLEFQLGPIRVLGLAPHYAAASAGEFVAVINSWGLLEIAVNSGNAQHLAGATVGDRVRVSWGKK